MLRPFSRRESAAVVILLVAISVTAFHLAGSIAAQNLDNELTFRQAIESTDNYLRLRQEWRPRVGSALAAKLTLLVSGSRDPAKELRNTVGLHTALWLLATNVVLLRGYGRRALPIIWGLVAALAFGYAPGLVSRIYPWDLPALFFFAAFMVIMEHDRWRWLPAVVLVGALFKETTVVLCLAPLFRAGRTWRQRLVAAGSLLGAFVAMKVGVDLLVKNPVLLLSPTAQPLEGDTWRLTENLKLLKRPPYTHPLWINAGTLAALALVPARLKLVPMTRAVALAFTAAIMVFGVAAEYRIWFELAPLALVALSRWLLWNDDATM